MNVFISSTVVPSSFKATSTSKLSTASMAKTTDSNKAVTDASKIKTSTKIMKKKNQQIMELYQMKRMRKGKILTNNMEDDSKVNKVKKKIQNVDGFLAGSGNFRSRFLPILYWKKELEMLLQLLNSFGMKEV